MQPLTFMKNKYLICLLVSIIFSSCRSGDESNDNSNVFKIDSTKISYQFTSTELGISFNPPVKWQIIPNFKSSKRILKFRTQGNEEFISNTLYAFMDAENKSNLTLTRIIFTGDMNKFKDFLGIYVQLQRLNTKSEKFTDAEVTIADLKVRYLTTQKENLVSKKFILLNKRNEIIQFDYTLSAADNKNIEEVINSSISTLRVID